MASRGKSAPSSEVAKSSPPNQTLYVSNLPEKLQKADLRRNLYYLFTAYGPVLDVVALKTMKMRGQAFVVFRDIGAATQALRSLQGFDFFGKEIAIQYAKSKSDTIAKLDGTFKIPVFAQAGAATDGTTTERSQVQQSIFAAPPGAAAAGQSKAAAPGNAPTEAQGTKRPREEEEDQPMEEDSDEGAEMEMDESD